MTTKDIRMGLRIAAVNLDGWSRSTEISAARSDKLESQAQALRDLEKGVAQLEPSLDFLEWLKRNQRKARKASLDMAVIEQRLEFLAWIERQDPERVKAWKVAFARSED